MLVVIRLQLDAVDEALPTIEAYIEDRFVRIFIRDGSNEAGFTAMTLRPTDDQLKTLQSVEQSIAGIDAVPNKAAGFDCVIYGWLEHQEHRRDDGGLVDVWRLTEEGRLVLSSSIPRPTIEAA